MSSEDITTEEFNPGWRFMAAFWSISIVNLACALDATTISVALPIISNALHGTSIEAFWVGTSFLLASAVWQPAFITFSHVFGRKLLLLLALVLFTIGAILCALSKGMMLMLVGRVIQGSGVGGIMTITQTLITDMVPLRHRGNYFAMIAIMWAIGTISGPLVGGVLAQVGAWRWIFWLNLPIVAIGFFGIIVFLTLEQSEKSLKDRLSEIDYFGLFLFVASTTSFLVPITWGGVMFAWSSWHTLVPMLLGLTGLASFGLYESRATYTLLPLEIFRNRTTSLTYLITTLHGIILWSIVYYLPLYFMAVLGYTSLLAGVSGMPQTLTVVPCAAIVGIIAARTGRYRWALWTGWILTVLGVGLLCLLDVNTPVVEWVFLLLISGIGVGLLFPVMNLSIQASVPVKHIATSAGMFAFFRAFGQSIGVAIGGVIFQNRMQHELQAHPELLIISADAVSLIEAIRSDTFDATYMAILKFAFAKSIRMIWAVMTGLAGVSLVATYFIKGYTLNQVHAPDQGFVGAAKPKDDVVENGLPNQGEGLVSIIDVSASISSRESTVLRENKEV